MTMTHIETVPVGSGGAASITFSAIPDTFTDLVIKYSLRSSNNSIDAGLWYFNGDTTAGNYSMKILIGDGASAGSYQNLNYLSQYNNWSSFFINPANATGSTFQSASVYIPNYSSSTTFKSVSLEGVTENNAAAAFQSVASGVYKSNSPITSITITAPLSGVFVQHSSASLYGVTKGSDGNVSVS